MTGWLDRGVELCDNGGRLGDGDLGDGVARPVHPLGAGRHVAQLEHVDHVEVDNVEHLRKNRFKKISLKNRSGVYKRQ